ncbi:hypothetical protein [Iningainema tapete]|uniref:Uncharacterized protein n=1 Tax=Iningainema tapete BLCC-T55 TaxID=2748662 RepID=A0A8J7C7R3_9CYAN|nr:hypothetical protein [Iningainema tapete]MBD2773611.1 hypothetical protein [Iningainema tapete BLCC-T55]
MNPNNEINQQMLSEQAIDEIVEAQVDDDSAWESPIHVNQKQTSVSISGELAAKAVFFAGLHRETNVESWLTRVIQERLELEEAAFREIKGDLARNSGK